MSQSGHRRGSASKSCLYLETALLAPIPLEQDRQLLPKHTSSVVDQRGLYPLQIHSDNFLIFQVSGLLPTHTSTMASANDFKALEAGTYLNGADYLNEKEDKLAIEDSRTKETTASEAPKPAHKFSKMASLRYMFMTLALLGVFIISISSAAAVRPKDCHTQTAEEIRFQELLATVSDEALHEVLEVHISSKYKPGVWREDRTAMSAVHKDDAARATSLVQLARRQNISMTTEVETVTAPTTSTVVVPPTNTDEPEPSTTADQEPSTTQAPDEPTETSTVLPSTQDPTVSVASPTVPPVTSTALPTEAETSVTEAESSQTTEPPVSTETFQSTESSEPPTSSTDAPESSQTSASPSATPTSPSESVTPTATPSTTATSTRASATSTTVQTTTTRESSMTTSMATSARSTTADRESSANEEVQSSMTQEVVFTTVKPDGSRSTITSYTIVPAAEATQNGTPGPTFTPEVQDAATSLSGAGLLGFAVVGLTAIIAAL